MFGCTGSLCCYKWAFSSCCEQGLHSNCSAAVSPCSGFSLQLPGSKVQAQWLWHTGLAAPQHAESSQTRDQTTPLMSAVRFFITEPPGKPRSILITPISEMKLGHRESIVRT